MLRKFGLTGLNVVFLASIREVFLFGRMEGFELIIKDELQGRAIHFKYARVSRVKYCQDCEASQCHSTGSQIWLSCRFQQGWKSVNSMCNLPEKDAKIKEKQK